MGKAALRPSRAVGQLLRERRKEMKLTLVAVSEQMAEKGDRIPPSTLARIEQGQLDPGVRRLHLLLRLYDVPPHLVADLVDLETLSVERPRFEEDLEGLLRTGVEHWQKGNIEQGLAYLFAIREYVTDDPEKRLLRQNATMSIASFARNLGKYRLAKQIVDDLLCEPPEPSLKPRVLVLASTIWLGLGSLDMALALVRQAEVHVDPQNDKDSAWVMHQHAKLLGEVGQLDEAERVLETALEHYRRVPDTYGECRGLILRMNLMEKRLDIQAAIQAARNVVEQSRNHKYGRLEITGKIALGCLLVRAGKVDDSETVIDEALRQARGIKDRYLEFLAHYHLWKGHEASGDRHRARFELESARYFVKFIDDNSPEADEIRARSKEG